MRQNPIHSRLCRTSYNDRGRKFDFTFMYWGHVAMKITRVDFQKVRPKGTGSKNLKWPPATPDKSMIAHNFQRNAPRIFILVSTARFLGGRNSKNYNNKP